MQAVIMAAGRGTRMGALTDTTPKPMLRVSGKTLLEHKLLALPEAVDEVILIVGYQKESITESLGEMYAGKRIKYVTQEKLDGTMGALLCAKPLLHDRFIVLMGDDLYGAKDIRELSMKKNWALVVWPTAHMASGGKVIISDGHITEIREGNHAGTEGNMCTNLFLLDTRVFDYPMIPKSAGSDEYGLPQTVVPASLEGNIPLEAVTGTAWFQVTAPEDLYQAEAWLKSNKD